MSTPEVVGWTFVAPSTRPCHYNSRYEVRGRFPVLGGLLTYGGQGGWRRAEFKLRDRLTYNS